MAKKRVKKKKRRAGKVRSAERKPLLSLAMMVRDEEEFLEPALLSARDWVDEMVVVDTGSTDRTVEIAQDLGARVEYFPWCDSFSKARMATLEHSRGEWVAILDADERFRGQQPGNIRKHLKPGPRWPFEALMVNVLNVRLDGSPMSSFFSIRFFPNQPDKLGYGGRVHNRFGPLVEGVTVEATRYLGLEVVHLGYDPEVYVARKKAERSLPLIERTVAETPDDLQYRFYLGREYYLLGRIDEAIEHLDFAWGRLVERGGRSPLQETVTILCKALEVADRFDRAFEVAEATLPFYPGHPDLLFARARAFAHRENHPAVVEDCAAALQGLRQRVIEGQIELSHHPWQAEELLANALFKLQRYAEAYQLYLQVLPLKPAAEEGWPVLLNSICALAIEFADRDRVPALLERLLAHPSAPLGMFFFEVQRQAREIGPDAARAFLTDGRERCARLAADPEYAAIANELGIP